MVGWYLAGQEDMQKSQWTDTVGFSITITTTKEYNNDPTRL